MKNAMTYKGYMVRVKFDPRDNIFVGKIMGSQTVLLSTERP